MGERGLAMRARNPWKDCEHAGVVNDVFPLALNDHGGGTGDGYQLADGREKERNGSRRFAERRGIVPHAHSTLVAERYERKEGVWAESGGKVYTTAAQHILRRALWA